MNLLQSFYEISNTHTHTYTHMHITLGDNESNVAMSKEKQNYTIFFDISI